MLSRSLVAFLLLGLLTPLCSHAGEIILSAVGNGRWQVSATGLANVHALDLDLRYEPQRLTNLTATAGAGLAGAMSAINDKVPGIVRLGVAASQPLATNGILLNLQSSAPGAELVVARFTVKTVDAEGKVVATTLRQELPAPSSMPETLAMTATEQRTETPVAAPVATVRPRHGGGASVGSSPVVSGAGSPPLTPPDEVPPFPAAATAVSTATVPSAASGAEKRFHSQEEIVTAIERLPRPWTVAAVKAIFSKPAIASPVRQEPLVALADGKSRVMLYLPKSLSKKKPAIGAQGCGVEEIRDAGEQGWEIELITRKGVWPAKALLLGEGDLIQFPVVIVPFLAITPPASDSAIIPLTDLNADKSLTALDAYLYVGNLLAQPERK